MKKVNLILYILISYKILNYFAFFLNNKKFKIEILKAYIF